jgi:hypothetical protein
MCNVQAIHLCTSRRDFAPRSLTDWLERGLVPTSQQISVFRTIPGRMYYCDRGFSFVLGFIIFSMFSIVAAASDRQ